MNFTIIEIGLFKASLCALDDYMKHQGRSQYEANRGTCLSHLRFD